MTIITATAPDITYTATGGQTAFSIPFGFFAAADLVVTDNGSATALTTDYTVAGSTLTFLVGRSAGHEIRIRRLTPRTRPSSYLVGGPFGANAINDDLYRALAISQEIEAQSLQVGETNTNLSYDAATRVLASSTGTGATLPLVTSSAAGLVPTAPNDAAQFLRGDGAWAAPPGSGTLDGLTDVNTTGAASGNALVFNGTDWVDGPLNLSSANAVSGTLPMARGGIGSNGAVASDAGLPLIIGEFAGVPHAAPETLTTVGIADAAVTYAKIQNVSATNRLLGRSSAGAGVVEEITCTAAGRALIDDADAAAQRTTLSVPEITSGSWSPSSYTGFSVNPSITFNWEKIGNTVTVRVASATDGTSNASTFNCAGNMPASITPAANRVAMLPVRLTVDYGGGGAHLVRTMLGIVNVGATGALGLNVPESILDATYRESAATSLGGGNGTSTSGGAHAKGLVVGSCFTYLL